MGIQTFLLLIIAIAIGVGLGTGRIKIVNDLESLFPLVKYGFMAIVFLILLVTSGIIFSNIFLSIFADYNSLVIIILSWILAFTVAAYLLVLFFNVKKYGLGKGITETFKDNTPKKTQEDIKKDNTQKLKDKQTMKNVIYLIISGFIIFILIIIWGMLKGYN
jgi:hypothetical protein